MPAKTCSIDGCEKRTSGRGLCSSHYHRLRRYGDPLHIPSQAKQRKWDAPDGTRVACQMDDCAKPVKAVGLCAMHYMRLRQHGDPTVTLRRYGVYRIILSSGYVGVWMPGHPLAGDHGYVLEHRLVMYDLGHAVDGMHVHHIDHDRTNNDPANLEVMTPHEHLQHHGGLPNAGQFQRQTHCGRGHEFTPENTYTYGDGNRRECYACKRNKRKAA